MRTRTSLQYLLAVVIIIAEVAGIVLIHNHERHAGSTVIGLGILAVFAFLVWTYFSRDHR